MKENSCGEEAPPGGKGKTKAMGRKVLRARKEPEGLRRVMGGGLGVGLEIVRPGPVSSWTVPK